MSKKPTSVVLAVRVDPRIKKAFEDHVKGSPQTARDCMEEALTMYFDREERELDSKKSSALTDIANKAAREGPQIIEGVLPEEAVVILTWSQLLEAVTPKISTVAERILRK